MIYGIVLAGRHMSYMYLVTAVWMTSVISDDVMNKCCVLYDVTYFFGSWNIDSERFPIGTCEVNRQVALMLVFR